MTDMGTFRTDFEIENPAAPGRRITIPSALVDTGSELTWVPAALLESLGIERAKLLRFRLADGRVLERSVGGPRTLSGLNVRVDPMRKEIVDAGPVPAAAA